MTDTVLTPGSPTEVGMDPVRVERVRQLCRGWVASGDTPSLQVLVARRGTIVLHEAFGALRPGPSAPPLRLDSIFPIASCTKPITATAVMCLVDDGLVGLNRPFVDYVPEWDGSGVDGLADARVADLLCHTAGLDDLEIDAHVGGRVANAPDVDPARDRHRLLENIVRFGGEVPLARPPGDAAIYSNTGFLLLGDIVRRVSGTSFARFVHDRIFDPLGMRDSHLVLSGELRATRRVFRAPDAPGTLPGGWFRGIDSEDFDDFDAGAGGVASTAGDLAVFAQMLLNGGEYGGRRVLSPAAVQTMVTRQTAPSLPNIFPYRDPTTGERHETVVRGGAWGLGLFRHDNGDCFVTNGSLPSDQTYGHLGMGGSYFWVDPAEELVGVYLSVSPRFHRDFILMNSDLFTNAVHAAIVD